MKRRTLLLFTPLLACNVNPTTPTFDLNGRWAYNAVDVGSAMNLTVQNGAITGAGSAFTVFGTDSFQVQGTYTPPQILLQFVYDSGQACSYIATLKTGVTMMGTESCGSRSPMPVNFSR
ncbi:MAG TPA: hypothetical protein VH113_00255 [Gemmatimonadales bacterium]|jgi:hypothetical protein|nr:hypothetical protein [Gemmatimonadales bacterium]